MSVVVERVAESGCLSIVCGFFEWMCCGGGGDLSLARPVVWLESSARGDLARSRHNNAQSDGSSFFLPLLPLIERTTKI